MDCGRRSTRDTVEYKSVLVTRQSGWSVLPIGWGLAVRSKHESSNIAGRRIIELVLYGKVDSSHFPTGWECVYFVAQNQTVAEIVQRDRQDLQTSGQSPSGFDLGVVDVLARFDIF